MALAAVGSATPISLSCVPVLILGVGADTFMLLVCCFFGADRRGADGPSGATTIERAVRAVEQVVRQAAANTLALAAMMVAIRFLTPLNSLRSFCAQAALALVVCCALHSVCTLSLFVALDARFGPTVYANTI